MGVKIKSLLEIDPIDFSDLKGKYITIDAANALYQFLAITQPSTGLPLLDSKNRVTSHLSGIFYRTLRLIEKDIRPIYVFDGARPKLKGKTIEERKAVRENAHKEWVTAIEEGDLEKAKKFGPSAHRLTSEMIDDSKKLLVAMGIPIVEAPCEGEAQASFMVGKNEVWAVATQDFDAVLFGAPKIVRNLSLAQKYEPELIISSKNYQKLNISREQFIDIGILIGTDFNEGIKGIGAKTALKLIKENKDLKTVIKEKGFEFDRSEEELEEIRIFFNKPIVTEKYKVDFKTSNDNEIKRILIDEHQFDPARVEKGIKRLKKGLSFKQQMNLEKWFK